MDELRRLAGPMFATINRSGLAILVTNPRLPDNPIIFVNAAFTDLTGYPSHEVIGRNPRFMQGSDTDKAVVAQIGRSLAEQKQLEAELLNYRKDGSLLFDENQTLAFFFGSLLDLTAVHDAKSREVRLQRRQKELDDANERLRITLEISGAAAAWEWQIPQGRLFGDARFAALYGLDASAAAEGVDPRLFFSIIHPEDQARIRLAVGGMLRGAEVFAKEYRLILADGSMRWVQARGRCNYDEAERPSRFIGALVDITEQKRTEEQLRIAQSAGGIGTFQYIEGFGTVSVSTQFCQLLGLHAANDLPVRTVNSVVNPADPPIIDRAVQPVVGTVHQVEFRITRPDNGETPRRLIYASSA
jgi:PAS domain S-box-containing protein